MTMLQHRIHHTPRGHLIVHIELRISRLAGWFPEDFGNWAIASSTRMWWF